MTTSDGDRLELGTFTIPHSAPLGIPPPHGSNTDEDDWGHGAHTHNHVLENGNLDRRKELELRIDSKSPDRKDSGTEQGSDGEASQASSAVLSPASIDEPMTPMNGVLSPTSASVETEKKPHRSGPHEGQTRSDRAATRN